MAKTKPVRQHHIALYNGREVVIDYVDDPKREFGVAAMRVRDNLATGGEGYVRTPDDKWFLITTTSKMAKKVVCPSIS